MRTMVGAVPKSAMILAAGLGTRMRPLTDDRPKALVEVGGRPLIDRILDRLLAAGVERAVVNVHAFADRLEAHLAARRAGPEIRVSDERDRLLDTGGGLRRALPLLGEDPFFVINADALWVDGAENTLVMLARRFDPGEMDALLLAIPSAAAIGHVGPGDMMMDPLGRLCWRPEGIVATHVYGGVQMLAPEIVARQDEGVFSLRRVWDEAMAADRLRGLVHQGAWAHVGTPDAVDLAERRLPGMPAPPS